MPAHGRGAAGRRDGASEQERRRAAREPEGRLRGHTPCVRGPVELLAHGVVALDRGEVPAVELLEGAVRYVRGRGGRIVEGYPLEPTETMAPSTSMTTTVAGIGTIFAEPSISWNTSNFSIT